MTGAYVVHVSCQGGENLKLKQSGHGNAVKKKKAYVMVYIPVKSGGNFTVSVLPTS